MEGLSTRHPSQGLATNTRTTASTGRNVDTVSSIREFFMITPAQTPKLAVDEEKRRYWDLRYSKLTEVTRPLPSQFAAFVAGELKSPHRVVDFGCGDGRDSLFFSSFGHQTIGIDASGPAVKYCVHAAKTLGEEANFLTSAVDDPELAARISTSAGPTAIYARFFLHAITEAEEKSFFRCANTLTKAGDVMAVEYRTIRDLSQPKATDRHYRRFMDPGVFQMAAVRHGFQVRYAVEGFGFAKYNQDDAYVARCLLVRD